MNINSNSDTHPALGKIVRWFVLTGRKVTQI
jgi:hypothetical protein